MRLKLTVWALAVIAVAVVAVKAFDPFGWDDPFAPLPSVDPDTAAVPKDRSPRAVEESLRRIDPCRLLQAAGDEVGRVDGEVRARYVDNFPPSYCDMSLDGSSYKSIHLTLGEAFNVQDRYQSRRSELGGALTYVRRGCQIALPVDFSHAITFGGQGRHTCPEVRAVAEATATLLRHPARIWTERDISSWSTCGLLERALGKAGDKQTLSMGTSPTGGPGVDGCDAFRPHTSNLVFGGVSLDLTKDPDVDAEHGRETILRRTVRHGRTQAGCARYWREPALLDGRADGWLTLSARTCTKATELARRTISVLDRDNGVRPAAQRPILYRPDHAGLPANGACVDVPIDLIQRCAAYVDADVPDDPVELIRHADADPNVACAMALDEVRATFGSQMRPAVIDKADPATEYVDVVVRDEASCVFVGPGHEFEVWVQASATPVEESLVVDDINDTIGGHPAYEDDDLSAEHRIHVAFDDPAEPGQITGAVTSATGSRPDDKLRDLMTDLAENHL